MWDKMSNLYKRTFHRCFLPSFGSFGHAVSEEIFRNRPIRNKNCPWRPYLLAEWDEMKKLYRGPYIDAFCQVWIEHRVKLHVFGNNSKTVNNIRNLTWVKMMSTGRSNYPEILKKIWLPILGVIITPRRVIRFTSKLQGMYILTCCSCLLFKLNVYVL
jgi:hypothetical protein